MVLLSEVDEQITTLFTAQNGRELQLGLELGWAVGGNMEHVMLRSMGPS